MGKWRDSIYTWSSSSMKWLFKYRYGEMPDFLNLNNNLQAYKPIILSYCKKYIWLPTYVII